MIKKTADKVLSPHGRDLINDRNRDAPTPLIDGSIGGIKISPFRNNEIIARITAILLPEVHFNRFITTISPELDKVYPCGNRRTAGILAVPCNSLCMWGNGKRAHRSSHKVAYPDAPNFWGLDFFT